MTKNIEDSVSNSMLDDLLGEGDKKKKPAPVYTTYTGGRYSSGQSDFFDDSGYDTPRSYPRSAHSAPVRNRAQQLQAQRERDRLHGEYHVRAAKIARILDNAEVGKVAGGNSFVNLTIEEMDDIVTECMRELGDMLEEGGLVWNTTTQRGVRGALRDVVNDALYWRITDEREATGEYEDVRVQGWSDNDKKSEHGVSVEYDPITGEVV